MNVDTSTILVTGGTSGIGRALAQSLHARGNRVAVAGRRRGLLDAIARAHPGLVGFELDVDDPVSVAGLVRHVETGLPHLDVLVVNAGISRREELTAGGWDISVSEAIVQTNVIGALRIVHALLPVLRRAERATILVTTSNLAFIPRADFPTYCATKAFLHSWLQSLRHQLRATGVEVLELAPPYVATEMLGPEQATDPRAMPLADYVSEVVSLLAGGTHPNGEVLVARDRDRRTAERDGRYAAAYAAINPA